MRNMKKPLKSETKFQEENHKQLGVFQIAESELRIQQIKTKAHK